MSWENNLVYCPKCVEKYKNKMKDLFIGGYNGYYSIIVPPQNMVCQCGAKLIESPITIKEFDVIQTVTKNRDIIKSMMELKEKDPIEFELKMSQFRLQANEINKVQEQKRQQEQAAKEAQKIAQQKATVVCPRCGCTDIAVTNRGFSLVWGFIGSGTPMNVCRKCGRKWKVGEKC